jgi:hypothetical protein
MLNHFKGLARSWFFLTTGEQQALGLILLLLFLGTLGRWSYTRHNGSATHYPTSAPRPPIETLIDE